MVSQLLTSTPGSFSTGQLSSHSSPSLQRCVGLSQGFRGPRSQR